MPFPNIPFWKQSERMTVVSLPGVSGQMIRANGGYWRIRLIEMRLSRDWVFTTRLHPSFHLQYSFNGEYVQTLVGPQQLGAFRGDKRLVQMSPQVVTPPIPHTGAPFEIGLALIAVPGEELAEGMLNLLSGLSGAVGRLDVVAAVGIADLLRRGINTVLGLNTCEMRLGWSGQIGQHEFLNQTHIIVAPPGLSDWTPQNLSVIGGQLHIKNGDISRVSYLVFSIEVAERREDWFEIPDIKNALNDFNVELSRSSILREKYLACVETLLTVVRTSPFLISPQRDEIIEGLIAAKKNAEEQNSVLFRSESGTVAEKVIDDTRERMLQFYSRKSTDFIEDDSEGVHLDRTLNIGPIVS
ncbi:MAG: hypothetical protein HZB31_11285 [Nitrospirae bacterium]|nr:hypothetical protein [Nitrospirota bacterium]